MQGLFPCCVSLVITEQCDYLSRAYVPLTEVTNIEWRIIKSAWLTISTPSSMRFDS